MEQNLVPGPLVEPTEEQLYEHLGAQAPAVEALAAYATRLAAGVGNDEDGQQYVYAATAEVIRVPNEQLLVRGEQEYVEAALGAYAGGSTDSIGVTTTRKVRDNQTFIDDLKRDALAELPAVESLGPVGDPEDAATQMVLREEILIPPSPAPDEEAIVQTVVADYSGRPGQLPLLESQLKTEEDEHREKAKEAREQADENEAKVPKRINGHLWPQKDAVSLYRQVYEDRCTVRSEGFLAEVVGAARKGAAGLREAPRRLAEQQADLDAQLELQTTVPAGNSRVRIYDVDKALAEMGIPTQPSMAMRATLLTKLAARRTPEEIIRALRAQARWELTPLLPPPGRVCLTEVRQPDLTDADMIDTATQSVAEVFGELEDRAAASGVFLEFPNRVRRLLVVGGPERPALDPQQLDAEILHVPGVPALADAVVLLVLYPVEKSQLSLYVAGKTLLAGKADVSAYYATPEMRAHVAAQRAARTAEQTSGAGQTRSKAETDGRIPDLVP